MSGPEAGRLSFRQRDMNGWYSPRIDVFDSTDLCCSMKRKINMATHLRVPFEVNDSEVTKGARSIGGLL